jgi:hypothetical protein
MKAGVAAIGLMLAGGAHAAEIKIVEVKAYAFLEHAGKLSDHLLGGPGLVNAPKGGAPGGDTATGLFLDFTFAGDNNASPKYATATIDLTQTSRAGQLILTHKGFHQFHLRAGRPGAQGSVSRRRHLHAARYRRPRREDA